MAQKTKRIYPYPLLPNSRYKKFSIDKSLKKHYVLRLVCGKAHVRSKEDLDKQFKPSMKKEEFVLGVSVNLLSKFRKKDVLYKPDYIARPDWEKDWDEINSTPRPVSGISRLRKKSYFGFKVRDLENITFEYKPTKNVDAPDMRTLNLTLRVEHAPSKINFWHCNIYICERGSLDDIRTTLDDKVIQRIAKIVVPLMKNRALLPKLMKTKKVDKRTYYKTI